MTSSRPLDVQLPCDGEGDCMVCNVKAPTEETLTCSTCVTPWHVPCLLKKPETLASTVQWECPDCSGDSMPVAAAAADGKDNQLRASVRAIQADANLTEKQKAEKMQRLLSGKEVSSEEDEDDAAPKVFGGNLNCSICLNLLDRPVTTPCGHNFCLKCFAKWVGQGKSKCAKCRHEIPKKMASQPRINSSLVFAIRMAKTSKPSGSVGPVKVYHCIRNEDRPDKAYTTERAKKTGKANAASGKIFVTIPADHFGPILAVHDPTRGQGVLVGETWEDRFECRQWGAHFPHVAGIAGQKDYGAQSVALSGGYEDDEDHGEWFLYTGSGGRDLSGNKRTNKKQSSDQVFTKMNEALRESCRKGYPVRVVRSHKEKRSAYAPEKGVRYDGVYRIEKSWRKPGKQGFKVCRYLFVRCDNEPAPWTSDEQGDRPRPLPSIPELKKAIDITERKGSPSWDFDEQEGVWKWKKPPPPSQKTVSSEIPMDGIEQKRIKKVQKRNERERMRKGLSCQICRQLMTLPTTTPCGHNFCRECLDQHFAGKALVRQRSTGGRSLRAQKNILPCPVCPFDISEYLENPQVNRDLMDCIELLNEESGKVSDDEENAIGASDDTQNSDEESKSVESGEDNTGNSGPQDGLKDPSTEVGNIRASKRNKVGGTASDITGTAAQSVEQIEKVGGNKKAEKQEKAGASGRGCGRPRMVQATENNPGTEAKTASKVEAVDGGDSPASTLQVPSSDVDME